MTAPALTTLSRDALYQLGVQWTNAVLDLSNIARPTYRISHAYFTTGTDSSRMRGFYRRRTVYVNLPRCRLATKTPGYTWTFPGYKADLTPAGVVAHEVGHYVDELRGFPQLRGWTREANVSSYAPNRGERFAEAVKLFVTNPDLLRIGRPIRYETLCSMGLQPTTLLPWDEVLRQRGAHDRFFEAARRWITRRP